MLKVFFFGIISIVGKCDDMKNNKGQALVEFILILPVFLMIILCMIDFGKIFYAKYTLQNDLDLITDLYKQDKVDEYNNYALNQDINLEIIENSSLVTITVIKNVEINTPFLSNLLNNPYEAKESLTISNE